MSIENTGVIDAIGTNDEKSTITLLATDHLKWGDDDDQHMLLLQEKMNTYLRFYESREIFEHFPEAVNYRVILKISGSYDLNSKGKWFYDQMLPILQSANLLVELDLGRSEKN
jgi:hypothetical protein